MSNWKKGMRVKSVQDHDGCQDGIAIGDVVTLLEDRHDQNIQFCDKGGVTRTRNADRYELCEEAKYEINTVEFLTDKVNDLQQALAAESAERYKLEMEKHHREIADIKAEQRRSKQAAKAYLAFLAILVAIAAYFSEDVRFMLEFVLGFLTISAVVCTAFAAVIRVLD